ncbi:dnaJ-like protein in endoplasmic reticulum [Suhomyces tanzawaensis NRRL Y-17324]|uniref:DnaJ-like protein in endoplasmic reticulum n=1 Tax=Suhomyces tanzawaensis NRRL Y-17324 TaxID=984487 RepID=A0A1E4SQR2_9ASCO|nr:dnaJ-like protein in endoplasmic reticulum [Suhomyces tanzawaensis NRRL Y-17324]ODV81850.1 dnaJ-like protein in endoplasmic reticulum [Suhomyces tanzawaensis NRRL Y-17324]
MRLLFPIFAVLALLALHVLAKDYYKVLGLDKTCNDKQIKSAYKKLSLKYHPDKNPNDDEAHDKFLEVGEAYEVLSNPEKRSNYDQFGDPEGRKQQDFGFGDMFNQFFGGHAGHGHGGQRRGDSTQVNVHIPLKDFYNGHLLEFDVEMTNLCETCHGTGSEDKETHQCDRCHGSGQITVQRQLAPGMVQQIRMACDACGGRGNKILHPCKHCNGQGSHQGPRHYDVYIKPGTARDSNVVLEGEGERHPGIVPGDLIVNFREEFSKGWGYRRVNEHLYRTEVVTLNESLFGGWERRIRHLSDEEGEEEVVLRRDPGQMVINGEIEVLEGKGMPREGNENRDNDEFGNLYIEYRVLVPGGKKMEKGREYDEL